MDCGRCHHACGLDIAACRPSTYADTAAYTAWAQQVRAVIVDVDPHARVLNVQYHAMVMKVENTTETSHVTVRATTVEISVEQYVVA